MTDKMKANKLLIFSGTIMLLALSLYNLYWYFKPPKQVLGESQDLPAKKVFWGKYLDESPDYYPGWLEIAEIENQLGNTASAEAAIKHKVT